MKKLVLIIIAFYYGLPSVSAQSMPWSQDIFDAWIQLRAGDGKNNAIWWCEGEVYSYPSGKLVARMEGIDHGTVLKVAKDSVIQLNRKTFTYNDLQTNEVITERNGQKLDPIAYNYQKITYVLRNNKLRTWMEQGAGARLTKMGPMEGINVRKTGNTYIWTAPVFMDFMTPRGKYEAYENYDFFFTPSLKTTKEKYQLTWERYGDLPAALGGGKGVIHLVSYRVDKINDLPSEIFKRYLKEKAQLWLNPPKDLAEIAEMQK
jgi:hypothetical protein